MAVFICSVVNHFFAEGNEVLNEQTIIQKEGKMVKPDRIVITKDKKVYLLDYKTGVHNSKYQKQLEEYEKSIANMGFKVLRKTIVYIGENIEVVQF